MSRCRWQACIVTALCACAAALAGCEQSEQRTYERAITAAAVRGPGWDIPLWSLPSGSLSVSTFTEDAALDLESQYTWVAATQEVWQRCKGNSSPVLILEQLLGLPPQKDPKPGNQWHFFVFEVESRDLFRPCPGGVETAAAQGPKCRLNADLDPQLDPEFTQFLLQQWWSSHRATVEPGRDPEVGFPWTAMGWTYDWNPTSRTHRGVSEFVVKKTALINRLRTVSPADFCGASTPPIFASSE